MEWELCGDLLRLKCVYLLQYDRTNLVGALVGPRTNGMDRRNGELGRTQMARHAVLPQQRGVVVKENVFEMMICQSSMR